MFEKKVRKILTLLRKSDLQPGAETKDKKDDEEVIEGTVE